MDYVFYPVQLQLNRSALISDLIKEAIQVLPSLEYRQVEYLYVTYKNKRLSSYYDVADAVQDADPLEPFRIKVSKYTLEKVAYFDISKGCNHCC